MSQDHSLQQQRFELKYPIPEEITPWLRDFISSYLEVDDYGVDRPNFAYAVHSVYFDSDTLWTHHATINGVKNRFKLRLRYYDDNPNTPVFFEVKARVDNCILKQRCGVRRDAVPILAAGQLPEPSQLMSTGSRHLVALQRFNRLLLQLNARPKVHNSYMREAWVSPHDNSVRITFDRNVRIEPYFKAQPVIELYNPVRVFPNTILEVKFTTRYPDWFKVMVRRFNLMQFSSAKYCEGVERLGEYRFHNGEKTLDYNEALLYPLDTLVAGPAAFASLED